MEYTLLQNGKLVCSTSSAVEMMVELNASAEARRSEVVGLLDQLSLGSILVTVTGVIYTLDVNPRGGLFFRLATAGTGRHSLEEAADLLIVGDAAIVYSAGKSFSAAIDFMTTHFPRAIADNESPGVTAAT